MIYLILFIVFTVAIIVAAVATVISEHIAKKIKRKNMEIIAPQTYGKRYSEVLEHDFLSCLKLTNSYANNEEARQ